MHQVYIKKVVYGSCLLALGLWGLSFMVNAEDATQPPLAQPSVQTPEQISAPPATMPVTPVPVPVIIEEGKQYHRVSVAVSQNPRVQTFIAQDPGKIQVVTFFSYGCYGCQQLYPVVNQWAKFKEAPGSQTPIVMYRVPVVFHPSWESLAKIYYVLKMMGLSDQLDADFFTAVNQNHIDFSKDNVLEDFVKVRGVDPTAFMDTYRSFAVNRQFTQSSELSLAYQITLSPYFVVNTPAGSFFTSAVMAGSAEGLLRVLDHLIALKPPS